MTPAPARKPRPPASNRPARSPEAAALLAWYDRHHRILPWRALPGTAADPYRVWLSEIMLQQTTVKTVIPYYHRFVSRWPDVAALAAAPLEEVLQAWAGLGYYARARNLHACAGVVAETHGGRFPADEADLRALPGVGAYTAAAVAAIAFGARATPVDGNVERVTARLFALDAPLPGAKAQVRGLAASLTPAQRPGDFAQAMMDLGATLCTPKRPACALCPWIGTCAARRRGTPELFPRKAARKAGRLRRGIAFVVTRPDGAVLTRTRPPRGLLGGMTEVPTSAWCEQFDEGAALAQAPRLAARPGRPPAALAWQRLPGVVTHVFTHFPLQLTVYAAQAPALAPPPEGMRWLPPAELAAAALPSLMRKVIAHAAAAPAPGCPVAAAMV